MHARKRTRYLPRPPPVASLSHVACSPTFAMQDEIEALIQENVGDLPNFRMGGTTTDFEADGAALGVAAETSPDVPDVIRSFIVYFQKNMREGNVHEVHSIYETSFNKLTDRFYKSSPWPPAEAIAPLVDNDQQFLLFYKELYYRHVYAKLQPTLEQRFESWANYCDIFNLLLEGDEPLALDLPNQWLWDLIDEFIYQFQTYCQRARVKSKTDDELKALRDSPQSCGPEGRLLPARPRREGRDQRDALRCESFPRLPTARPAEAPCAPSARRDAALLLSPTCRLPGACRRADIDKVRGLVVVQDGGHFSLVGLLRVHCLLADYRLALQSVSSIDLGKKGLFTRVTACHISIFYYVGFAYLMVIAGRPTRVCSLMRLPVTNRPCSQMRRYSDAVRTFSNILFYIARTKQYHTRSYQYDQIVKNEQANTAAPDIPLPPPSPPSHPSLSLPHPPSSSHHPSPPSTAPALCRLDPPCRPPLRADVRALALGVAPARSSPSTST